jgi:hypothetical protein
MNAAEAEPAASTVAELQGLYGPFIFPEKLLQKIWWRGAFDRGRLVANDGRQVKIQHGGRWNLLGGPDFKGARLRFDDGPEVIGDVELHLRAGDWASHRHAHDPAYDQVILHVVLFPTDPTELTIGAGGTLIPMVALLPLLHHDLEEYATEEAVEMLANRPAAQILEVLGPLPSDELAALVAKHSRERWRQKVHFARLRIARLGWDGACHQTALEVLGYRFNRAPMLRLAARLPISEWSTPHFDVESVFESERAGWSLQGLRPANHPRRRLNQYGAWLRVRPQWPTALEAWATELPAIDPDENTGSARKRHAFRLLREHAVNVLCANAVGGTRFDTLLCDAFLPLLSAQTSRDGFRLWYHWFPGDLPPLYNQALRQLQVFGGRNQPACHGAAQGLLGWLIERETFTQGPAGRGA